MADIENVIKGVHDARRYLEDKEWVDKSVGVHIDALNDALELLKEQQQIVRCGDCVNRRVCVIAKKHDGFTDNIFDPNWFCADGEKKDG